MRITLMEILFFVLMTIGFTYLFSGGTLFGKKKKTKTNENDKSRGNAIDLDVLSVEGIVDMLSLCLIDPNDADPRTSAASLLKVLHKRLDNKEQLKQVSLETKKKLSTILVSFLEMSNISIETLQDVIVSVGLYVLDDVALQTMISDDGGVKAMIQSLKSNTSVDYRDITKWYFWAFTNLCFNHPPNKCEFVHCGGLCVAIDALKRDKPKDNMVQKQGLSLLAYILRDDEQSKFHLGDARRSTITHGLVKLIQEVQQEFKNDTDMLTPCSYLLELLSVAY